MNESTLVPREERKIFGANDAIDYAEAESKRVSDLDWLARNVHAWPCGSHQSWCYVVTDDNGRKIASSSTLGSPKATWISKPEWLSRREEIQSKPDWCKIGERAMYIAQNSCGTWRAFEWDPTDYCHAWIEERGLQEYKTKGWKGEVLGDWRDTLEKRPEQDELEPFVSVEDSATAKRHDPVNSPSHYASGGIECIEAIKASMSHESFLGYLKGNVQKYMWRYEKKVNPAEDLKKARWYLDKLIEEQK